MIVCPSCKRRILEITCIYCGKLMPIENDFCPACGKPVHVDRKLHVYIDFQLDDKDKKDGKDKSYPTHKGPAGSASWKWDPPALDKASLDEWMKEQITQWLEKKWELVVTDINQLYTMDMEPQTLTADGSSQEKKQNVYKGASFIVRPTENISRVELARVPPGDHLYLMGKEISPEKFKRPASSGCSGGASLIILLIIMVSVLIFFASQAPH